MTKQERDSILVACARMRQTHGFGPDVRQFLFEDVVTVRAAFERLSAYVDRLELHATVGLTR